MIELPNGWRVVCFLEIERDKKYRMTLRNGARMQYIESESEMSLRRDCREFAYSFKPKNKITKYINEIELLKQGKSVCLNTRNQVIVLIRNAKKHDLSVYSISTPLGFKVFRD